MNDLSLRLTRAAVAAQALIAELSELVALAEGYAPIVVATPPAPGPEPAPAPIPAPAPTPEPPPTAVQILPVSTPVNPGQQILFSAYQRDEQAYDRNDDLLLFALLKGPTATIEIRGASALNSGADRVLLSTQYRLLVDDVPKATVDVVAGTKRIRFVLQLGDLSEGWHSLDVSSDTTETTVTWCCYVQRGAVPVPQPTMPVIMGAHDLLGDTKTFRATVPAVFDPTILPLAPRDTPAFSDTLNRSSMVAIDLVPWRDGDLYRPRVTGGILHTFNLEPYYWSTLESNKFPALATLDGPRGLGNAAMVTHLQVGRNSTYFCDGYRIGKVTADGTVITLAGWRHDAPAPRPASPLTDAALLASLQLVGDFSKAGAKGFHGAWGFDWDQASLPINEGSQPIPNNGTLEKPHLTGPRLFVADSLNKRIALVTFAKDSHDVPAKVTDFITGLADPWDCVCEAGVLYISERQANRIVAYDATTGAFLRVVVSGATGLAKVDQSRFVARVADLATIRAQQCVLPEGLYHQDGWLYFGSIAMGQVRRVNLATGEIRVCVADITYRFSGTNFCKIAVSDGSFGPRGTVFLVTWSNAAQGRPKAWLPSGAEWAWAGVGAGLSGPGRAWETLGYGSAVAVGQGRLVCGTSSEGITQHSKALPSDVVIKNPADARQSANNYWTKLRTAYQEAGLQITHGPGGFGYFGLPLPWGISPEIDAYLQAYGHQRPA